MLNVKKISNGTLVICVLIALFIGAGIGYALGYDHGFERPDTSDNEVYCTQDAKLCPDGSYVGRIAPDCAFAECPAPAAASFGNSITLSAGDQVTFEDGLQATLTAINDSRCKADVVCIWEGELAPVFRITGGNAGKSLKEIHLGTRTRGSVTENGYTFSLQDATETSATIVVTKED